MASTLAVEPSSRRLTEIRRYVLYYTGPMKFAHPDLVCAIQELLKNWIFRTLDQNIESDPFEFLLELAKREFTPSAWTSWTIHLKTRDDEREREIAEQAERETQRLKKEKAKFLNPIRSLQIIEKSLPKNSLLVADVSVSLLL